MIRTDFNPLKNDAVDQIKQKAAELINLVQEIKMDLGNNLQIEARNIAYQRIQEGAMWAVKAATA